MLSEKDVLKICENCADQVNLKAACENAGLYIQRGKHHEAAQLLQKAIYYAIAASLHTVLTEYEKQNSK